MYLICDNGYLQWPTSICPHVNYTAASVEGYFSSNLESVRKDVECTFGILKKRWKILNNGLLHRDMRTCEKTFVACCCLHNFLIDIIDRSSVRVGRGIPFVSDGIWFDSHTSSSVNHNMGDSALAIQF